MGAREAVQAGGGSLGGETAHGDGLSTTNGKGSAGNSYAGKHGVRGCV